MKNKLTAVLLMAVMVCAMIPSKAFAADIAVDETNGNTASVEAAANVTAEDLADLGLNLIVSLPASVALTRSGKNFSGSGKIYAYGFMDAAKTLKITVDEGNAAYGKVKYLGTAEGSTAAEFDEDYYDSVDIRLTGGSFSALQTQANYVSHENNADMAHYAALSVGIKNLLPVSGAGKYYTDVPIRIVIE